uniref:Transmembrane protein 128 n=1 Tax=Mantoniella antarctica TaxID=81844 RepID=A0A7S0X461_9CHLO|mmetsp:Transcript_12057/g.29240  ORF Transcript_12057/g.29240 Transcript_12057/m.29240 type:complete len:169 (+) Transcript_12057:129-635(+)
MGAYERLVAEDEDSHDGKLVDAQHRAKRRRLVREKLERLLWILASVALVSFGDGAHNLVTLVLHRYNEARLWFLIATLSLALNLCILSYLVVYLQFHRRGSKWEDSASWALPVSCCLGAASFVGFGVVLWPIYGWTTPVVEVVLCMGFLMATQFLPGLGTTARLAHTD